MTRSIQIKQAVKFPPHYYLIVGNTIWDIYGVSFTFNPTKLNCSQKRNNLFQCLCIFLYYIQVECSGYIGLLDMNTKGIDLGEVVSRGERLELEEDQSDDSSAVKWLWDLIYGKREKQ